jgi:hypothetical protein
MVGVLEQAHPAAPLIATHLPALLEALDDGALAAFVATALQQHETSPQRASAFLKMESATAHVVANEGKTGTSLVSMIRSLSLYAQAHCGAAVRIMPGGEHAFTDGRHLYLPERIDIFNDERDETAYWVATARAAGFIEFGSLNIDLNQVSGPWPTARPDEMPFERMVRGFDNPSVASALFLIFERARVEAKLRLVYPGVARRIDTLDSALTGRGNWGDSAVDKALAAVAAKLDGLPVSDGEANGVADRVLADNPGGVGVNGSVAAMVAGYRHIRGLMASATGPMVSPDFGFRPQAMSDADKAVEASAADLLRRLGGEDGIERARKTVLSQDVDGLSYAEMSDFLDRLEAPGGPMAKEDDVGLVGRDLRHDPDVDPEAQVLRFRYPEWDHILGEYKPDWTTVSEFALAGGSAEFVSGVISEYGGLIADLRRTFEALRPEAMRFKRGLADGEELDMDAVIAARMARKAGVSGPAGVYRSRRRNQRDVAVAFLVDMSSSTNEHINTASKKIIDVEREALVVAAEAIVALGDPLAIYGYSGFGRHSVAFYVAKAFDDPWDGRVAERIGRLNWKMENRDGAAIRHAVAKLERGPAKVKLLILLSDGKPLDCGCDQYSDEYAQADTKMALAEAKAAGVHPFCITVDPYGRGYLREMYGEGGYIIIDSVAALPMQLPTIYRRLTSR